MDLKALVAAHLASARARTDALLAPFDDHDLQRQVSPIMSPLVWDLAHIGHYEELWLIRALAGDAPTDARFDDLYDAFRHPRRERAELPILGPDAARRFVADVRVRTLEILDGIELDNENPLLDLGLVYGMVIQHEHMHIETMLATIQLMGCVYDVAVCSPGFGDERLACRLGARSRSPGEQAWVDLPGGVFVMGTDAEPWAFDNERPAHEVEIAPLRFGTMLVTNAEYLAFIEDGGYDEPRHWDEAGWKWRQVAGLEHPYGWRREGEGTWSVLQFGRRDDLDPQEPVEHVSWYEADACARWAGARLPTEVEWEYAASWAPDGRKRRYPWGDEDSGSIGRLRSASAPPAAVGKAAAAGSNAEGASAWGCEQLVGDVWEWTSSDFRGYPGFRAHPYREYSEVFFGSEYKVLRGGSWAVPPVACRNTFRNWDYPIRRQIFSGFRLAHDA